MFVCSIDGRSTDRLGRFVNDAPRKTAYCNSVAKSAFIVGKPHVLLFASVDIEPGTEIRYDYDGNDMPWRKVSIVFFKK